MCILSVKCFKRLTKFIISSKFSSFVNSVMEQSVLESLLEETIKIVEQESRTTQKLQVRKSNTILRKCTELVTLRGQGYSIRVISSVTLYNVIN